MRQGSKKKYNPISAAISYTIGNILIKAIPFFTLPIFTRLLTTEDFGLYNTYLSYENILTILLGFGFVSTIRIAKVHFKDDFEKYVSSIFGIQIILSILCDIVLFVAFFFIKRVYSDFWLSNFLAVVLLANCLCSQLYNLASAKYAINGEVFKNLLISVIFTVINIASSLLLCIFAFKNETYIGRILGTFLGAFLTAIFVAVFQFRKSFHIFNKTFWLFGLRMGAPLIIHSLSLTLLSQCDKIMIQSMIGSSEAGIYSLAVTLDGLVLVVVGSVDNAWAPWFFSKIDEGAYKEAYDGNNKMIFVFSVLVVGIILVSPELIKIVSKKDYWDSSYSFPPLAISALFNFYYLIPVNFEYYNKKTAYIAICTVIVATINIALNYVLLKTIGYIGAAYATCASKIILFIMHWFRAKALSKEKIASLLYVAVCGTLAIGIMVLVVLFNNQILLRYLILSIVIVASIITAIKLHIIDYFKSVLTHKKQIVIESGEDLNE